MREPWPKATVEVAFSFSGTHNLSFGKKEARKQHRHIWNGWLGYTAEINPNQSHCLDFDEVLSDCRGVIDAVDGKNLNEMFVDPTLEVLAHYILRGTPGYVQWVTLQAGSARVTVKRNQLHNSWLIGQIK